MFITYKGGRKNVFKHGVKEMDLGFLKPIQLVAGCIGIISVALLIASLPLFQSDSLEICDKLCDITAVLASVTIFSFIIWIASTGAIMDKEKHDRDTVKSNDRAITTNYDRDGISSSSFYGISIYTS